MLRISAVMKRECYLELDEKVPLIKDLRDLQGERVLTWGGFHWASGMSEQKVKNSKNREETQEF